MQYVCHNRIRPCRYTKLHFDEMPYLFLGHNAGILTPNLILKVSSAHSLPKCLTSSEGWNCKIYRDLWVPVKDAWPSVVCSFDAALTWLSASLVFKAKHLLQFKCLCCVSSRRSDDWTKLTTDECVEHRSHPVLWTNRCICCLPQNVYRIDLKIPENGGPCRWYIQPDTRSLSRVIL